MGEEDDMSGEDYEPTPEEEDYTTPCAPLVQKNGVIQHEHRNIDERPDSVSIGTDGKGGNVKVYFNVDDSERQTEDRIMRAFTARAIAQREAAKQEVPKSNVPM